MGVFSRFTDIVNANINAALDRAEDPEKVVRLLIQQMEETLVDVRSDSAGYLADKKTLERKAADFSRQSAQWGDKAELALAKDREDLARAALVEKYRFYADLEQLTSEIAKLNEILATLQQDCARLQEKLSEAKARQKAMNLRQTSAVTRLNVVQQIHRTDIDQAIERFDHYERRIDELEAQVEAYDLTSGKRLTQQFVKIEIDSKVENALVELKKKVANGL
ncbi:MAG: phage shock protein A [Alteromonadaceae bacterium]|jgi:phage shock protein A